MRTSRQRLLDYLRSQRAVTAGDLARALKMTPANARHHLNILLEQGLVEIVGQRQGDGRGRPGLVYQISDQASGHNLDGLASALLRAFLDGVPAERQEEALRRLAELLQSGSLKLSGSLTQRLFSAVQRLNELHYTARWEAHADGPRLILGHCPYEAILPEHPELCRLDAIFLETMLDSGVRQTRMLAVDKLGARYCLFQLGGINRKEAKIAKDFDIKP